MRPEELAAIEKRITPEDAVSDTDARALVAEVKFLRGVLKQREKGTDELLDKLQDEEGVRREHVSELRSALEALVHATMGAAEAGNAIPPALAEARRILAAGVPEDAP